MFTNAEINIINILPRADLKKNLIVKNLNSYIKNIFTLHGLKYICTEGANHRMFTETSGKRIDKLFSGGYDNVHLNEIGYSILGRYLKYLAHLNI